MAARDYIKDDVLIVYSDIIFDQSIISKIIESKVDIGIAIDMNWESVYVGRTDHPKTEAENVSLENGKILEIRKNISSHKQVGEFLGIVKLSAIGSKIFVDRFVELEKSHVGRFHDAPSLKKAYLTDMIQELVDCSVKVSPILISSKWCEIDTRQDLERAAKLFA
jgi:choline kinase